MKQALRRGAAIVLRRRHNSTEDRALLDHIASSLRPCLQIPRASLYASTTLHNLSAARPHDAVAAIPERGSPMRQRFSLVVVFLLFAGVVNARAEQTIVFLRHGEKPSGGYGQLTCQGLNRAFDLPRVLVSKYGRPNYLYAPSPAVQVTDSAGSFYYVRPLATIEPTAVKLGMPVRTKYGYNDIATLQAALVTSSKADTTIFVAWEHLALQKLVQNIMNKYGRGVAVPAWSSGDYDSLYVVKIEYGSTITARFQHDHEGLNGQPTSCPY
jgi:hypothetical protein